MRRPCSSPHLGFLSLGRQWLGADGPHEGAGHAAVEQEAPQDEEAAPPAELVEEPGVEQRQRRQEHGAACHGNAVGDGTPIVEVFTDHRQGGVQVKRQTQSCENRGSDIRPLLPV